jgi:hypothetical protein
MNLKNQQVEDEKEIKGKEKEEKEEKVPVENILPFNLKNSKTIQHRHLQFNNLVLETLCNDCCCLYADIVNIILQFLKPNDLLNVLLDDFCAVDKIHLMRLENDNDDNDKNHGDKNHEEKVSLCPTMSGDKPLTIIFPCKLGNIIEKNRGAGNHFYRRINFLTNGLKPEELKRLERNIIIVNSLFQYLFESEFLEGRFTQEQIFHHNLETGEVRGKSSLDKKNSIVFSYLQIEGDDKKLMVNNWPKGNDDDFSVGNSDLVLTCKSITFKKFSWENNRRRIISDTIYSANFL